MEAMRVLGQQGPRTWPEGAELTARLH